MTHAEWEATQRQAFKGVSREQMERQLAVLDAKRNPSHADYSAMDELRNALGDIDEQDDED
jgi:hypothetical protein